MTQMGIEQQKSIFALVSDKRCCLLVFVVQNLPSKYKITSVYVDAKWQYHVERLYIQQLKDLYCVCTYKFWAQNEAKGNRNLLILLFPNCKILTQTTLPIATDVGDSGDLRVLPALILSFFLSWIRILSHAMKSTIAQWTCASANAKARE